MRIKQSNQFGRRRLPFKISGALLAVLLCGPVYAQPVNDDCGDATVIPGSAPTPPYSDSVDATDATFDPADPLMSCNVIGDGNQTVWYKYTADESREIAINTYGSTTAGGLELDTVHAVYTGSCGALVEVVCIDAGLTDEGVADVEAGTTYYIKVGQFADASDAGTVMVTVDEPPEPELVVLESVRNGISPPMSSLGPSVLAARGASGKFLREVPNVMFDVRSPASVSGSQAVSTKGPEPLIAEFDPSDLLLSFDGIENDDNDLVVGGLIYPPDTNGDVGPNHYVQMANLVTEIFDKSGNSILGPIATSDFFTGLGGQCEFTNSGDPVVLYDEETDRWLITQFAIGAQFGLCVAVSTSGDPTGSYYQHEFDFTAVGFPDYPKWGFATDAINVMARMFNPFQGEAIGAIDKAEAMSAGPATMVFFLLGLSEFGYVAGDNDGPVFDNTLPTFFTSGGGSGDRIDVWEINPDFGTPANSTVDEVAKIPVTPFDSDLCNAFRERCIDQPEGAPRLEAIVSRLMHRGQIRDFGKRKVAMLSHTVDVDGTGRAGVRWYELWNRKDKGWELKKENTFSPDGDHRWMGSIAMNAAGQTCLGYSISSTETYTSVGVAGRNGTANHMNVGEFVVYDGNVDQHVQTGTAARWGDYSMMSIDPVDDSCWYTQEFARPNTRLGELAGWATGVWQFVVPDDDD